MAGHSKLQNEIPYFGVADWRAYVCLDNSRCFHQGCRIGLPYRAVGFPQIH